VLEEITLVFRCRNLVVTSSPTVSGETLACTKQVVVDKASSAMFLLVGATNSEPES